MRNPQYNPRNVLQQEKAVTWPVTSARNHVGKAFAHELWASLAATTQVYLESGTRRSVSIAEHTGLSKHLRVGCSLFFLCCSPGLLGFRQLFGYSSILLIELLSLCQTFYSIIQLLQSVARSSRQRLHCSSTC